MVMLSKSHTCNRRAQAAVESNCGSIACPLRRAQAAVEMLAYAAFFFMVFVTAVAVFLQVQGQELTRAENAYAQEIAYGFADSIHVAFVAGPGFSGSVSVPPKLLGKAYWLYLSKASDAASQETGFIYVAWDSANGEASFSAPTVTADYEIGPGSSGMVTYEGNYIVIDPSEGTRIKISNEGGKIKIEGLA